MLELETRPSSDLASPEKGASHPLTEYQTFFIALAAYHIAQSHPDNPIFDNLRDATASSKTTLVNAGIKVPPADFELPGEYQAFQPFFDVINRRGLPKMSRPEYSELFLKSVKDLPFKPETYLPWEDGQIKYADLESHLTKAMTLDHSLAHGLYGLVTRTRDILRGLGSASGLQPGRYSSDNALDLVSKDHGISNHLLRLMFQYRYPFGTEYPGLSKNIINSYLTLPEVQSLAPTLDLVQSVLSQEKIFPSQFFRTVGATWSSLIFGSQTVVGDSMQAFTGKNYDDLQIRPLAGQTMESLLSLLIGNNNANNQTNDVNEARYSHQGGIWLVFEGSELANLWEMVAKRPIPVGISFGQDDEKRLLQTFKLLVDTNPSQTTLLFGRNRTAEQIEQGSDLTRVNYTVNEEGVSNDWADFRYVDEYVIPTHSIKRIGLPLVFGSFFCDWKSSNRVTDALKSGPIPYDLGYQYLKGSR